MNNKKEEILVGLIVVFGVLILVGTIIWGKGYSASEDHQRIKFKFVEVNDLSVGNKVYIRGVQVGRIVGVKLKEDFVEIEALVRSKIKVYQDAIGFIYNKELMGGRVLILNPGSSTSGLLEPSSFIRGEEPRSLTSIFSKAGIIVEEAQSTMRKLQIFLDKLNILLPDSNFSKNIEEVAEHTKSAILESKKSINLLKSKSIVVLEGFETTISEINNFIKNGSLHMGGFQETLKKADLLLDESSELLKDFKYKLNSNYNSVGKAFNSTEAYDNLQNTVMRIDSLIKAIKKEGFRVNVDLF